MPYLNFCSSGHKISSPGVYGFKVYIEKTNISLLQGETFQLQVSWEVSHVALTDMSPKPGNTICQNGI
jgi:hypothetical protein